MELLQLKAVLYWTGVIVFLLLELGLSYRLPTVSKAHRWLTNIPLSILNGVIYQLVFATLILRLLTHVEQQGLGLLNQWPLASWLQVVLGILVLDFSIYLWHLLTHVVPFLWRFHRVHHSDLNMDVSTANRFHVGEFLVSGLVRLVTIHVFGIPIFAYVLFEMLVNLSIQFHHSSIRLPKAFEQLWMLLFVPPLLHRIHHSVKMAERDSNYGVLFSLWDRLLGTLRYDVAQEGIVIGIGSHRKFAQLGFWHMLAMPFTKQSR